MKLAGSAFGAVNRANFVFAPPAFEGLKSAFLREVKPPFPDAPGWQCSVYYYWYEYLRRHKGYEETCLNDGNGPCAKEFVTFGDVHALNFGEWWGERFWLFEERRPVRRLKRAPTLDSRGFPVDRDTLYLEIDLTAPPTQLFRDLKEEIWVQRMAAEERAQRAAATRAAKRKKPLPDLRLGPQKSTAHFPVETKPVLSALHEHLLVWDARKANPDAEDAEIADLAGIRVNQVVDGETIASRSLLKLPSDDIEKVLRRRKQLAVQRHLRIARQYIDNVVKGRFPLRTGR
ncbi:hypothetical protein [Marimonas arenosa]|uniref:Uncharacterized protein n=1 Tax=Marimonas arenosa TaxID=1795305 RepID=A0AAE3WDB1_9RHOB|nr:hypothetical protein [Marimonas arenosa]MDQ2091156.1 hypothetical protein [Marimonas arenosa]